jgi:hypothetical protein
MRRMSLLCAAMLALVLVNGCKDENPEIVFPVSDVSYGAYVQPLFEQKCNMSGCHGLGTHESPLYLTSYNNLMDPQLFEVTPGKPELSNLYLRITGKVLPQMPRNDVPLNENQQVGIGTWIREGAKNN